MVARAQILIDAGLLIWAAAWFSYLIDQGFHLWGITVALLPPIVLAVVLASELVLMRFTNRHDDVPYASLRQLARAWCGELLVGARVFCWLQPFRAKAIPDFLPSHHAGRGVVLVHGFICNRGMWNPWMARLRVKGIPFVAVDLEPVFASIESYAAIIDDAVHRMADCGFQPPVLVGHSMGGLAIRSWLDGSASDTRIHHVVTIGTPHRGTFLGKFMPTQNGMQMRPDGAWHRGLALREPASRLTRFTCFYSHCDNVVFPATSATLPGADNRLVRGYAHLEMAYQEAVFSEVLRCLEIPDTSPIVSSSSTSTRGDKTMSGPNRPR